MKLSKWVWVFAFLVCWPSMLFAEDKAQTYVANVGQNKLYILAEPCQLGGWFAKWRKARWMFNGETFDACWSVERTTEGLLVKTVDSAGDTGSIPLALFKPDAGV